MSTEPSQNPYTNQRIVKKKFGPDSAVIGLITGLIFPVLGLLVLYFLWSGNSNLASYCAMFTDFKSPIRMESASKAISLSMIANLIPFYFFLNRKQYMTVRGILISMLLIGVLIVLYKFVWQ